MPALSGAAGDWIGRQTGDHCGNYFDLVTKAYASVTRATPKTIYDPLTGKIHDVPAGALAVNPWAASYAGGRGYAPVIEEARTNYLVNSYFSAGAANAVPTGWTPAGVAGTVIYSRVQGVYGTTALRIQYTGTAGDTNATFIVTSTVSDAGTFAPTENATGSVYVKGSVVGGSGHTLTLIGRKADGTTLAGLASDVASVGAAFSRHVLTYANLPAETNRCQMRFVITGIDTGDTIDITIDAAQLEKGAFATSYIPTTTAAATRNADQPSGFTTWTPASGTGLITRSASLAPGTIATDEITSGTIEAAMLNRVVHRIALFNTTLDAATKAAYKAQMLAGANATGSAATLLALGII